MNRPSKQSRSAGPLLAISDARALTVGRLVNKMIRRLGAADRFERIGLVLNEALPAEFDGWWLAVLTARRLLAEGGADTVAAEFERELMGIVGPAVLAETHRGV